MSTAHDALADDRPAELDRTAKFPAAPYPTAAWYFDAYAEQVASAVRAIEPGAVDRAAAILAEAYARGAAVFACGNGGSR